MIVDFLKGKVRLVITYWVWNVAAWIAYYFIAKSLVSLHIDSKTIYLTYLVIAFPFFYFPFMYIAIWNSANNYKKSKKWAYLAKLSVILGSIFLVIAGINTYYLYWEIFGSSIGKVVNSLNKKAPFKIDKETVFMSASYNKNILSYNYKLIDLDASKIDKSIFYTHFKRISINIACRKGGLKPIMAYNDINISYNYFDKNSSFIQNIIVNKNDCEK
jgi:hypothetical protein